MAGAIVQEKWVVTTSTDHCDAAFTSTVTAGNTLIAVGFQGAPTVDTVSDGVNGSWGAVRASSPSILGRVLTLWCLQGSGNAGGTITVTGKCTGGANGASMYIAEISGCTSSSFVAAVANSQASPGGGTDAITTGTITLGGVTSFLAALSHHLGSVGAVTSAGTGWTAGGSGWPNGSNGSRGESKATQTSNQAATFTNATDTTNQFSGVFALAETVAATQVPFVRNTAALRSWDDVEEWPQQRRMLLVPPNPPAPDSPPLGGNRAAQLAAARAWWDEEDVEIAVPPQAGAVAFPATVDNPPVGWPLRIRQVGQAALSWEVEWQPPPVLRRLVQQAVPGNTMTVAATIDGPTMAASLAADEVMTVAATIPGPTSAGTLTSMNAMTVAATIPGPTSAAQLAADEVMTIAATIPGPTCVCVLLNPSAQGHLVYMGDAVCLDDHVINMGTAI